METTPENTAVEWHPETVTAATDALRSLRDQGLLTGSYLAGDTGLALRFGHRRSVDLDFFAGDLFDQAALLNRAQTTPGFRWCPSRRIRFMPQFTRSR